MEGDGTEIGVKAICAARRCKSSSDDLEIIVPLLLLLAAAADDDLAVEARFSACVDRESSSSTWERGLEERIRESDLLRVTGGAV